jgi:hypothetical protein
MRKENLQNLFSKKRATRSMKPAPYPGKYPTRIAVYYTSEQGGQWTYFGKPSPQILEQILKRSSLSFYIRAVYEFDRKNWVVRAVANYSDNVRKPEPEFVVGNLFNTYYPGVTPTPLLGHLAAKLRTERGM